MIVIQEDEFQLLSTRFLALPLPADDYPVWSIIDKTSAPVIVAEIIPIHHFLCKSKYALRIGNKVSEYIFHDRKSVFRMFCMMQDGKIFTWKNI